MTWMNSTGFMMGNNVWLYVFGFATHVLRFKAIQTIGKTDIYNVLPPVIYELFN